jgi:hypothetical protein
MSEDTNQQTQSGETGNQQGVDNSQNGQGSQPASQKTLSISDLSKSEVEKHPFVEKILKENFDYREAKRQREEDTLKEQNKFKELAELKDKELLQLKQEIDQAKKILEERQKADEEILKAKIKALTPEQQKSVESVFTKAKISDPQSKLALLDDLITAKGVDPLPKPAGSVDNNQQINKLLAEARNDKEKMQKVAEPNNFLSILQETITKQVYNKKK